MKTRRSSTAPALFLMALILMACGSSLAAPSWPDQRSGTFVGYWAMSGTVHVIAFPDGGTAGGGGLTGTVTIQTDQGPIPSFETDCVVFADNRTDGVGRCLWTATNGDLAIVNLVTNGPAGSGTLTGFFSGGTGRFANLTGRFLFEWTYSVGGTGDVDLNGASYEMRGQYDLKGE